MQGGPEVPQPSGSGPGHLRTLQPTPQGFGVDLSRLGDAGPADGDGVFGVASRHEESDLSSGATAIVAAGRRILGIGRGGHDASGDGGRSILAAHDGRMTLPPMVPFSA